METINRFLSVKLCPTAEQREQINANIRCARFTYNYMLDVQNKKYETDKKTYRQYEMQHIMVELKKEEGFEFLNDADSRAARYACQNLDFAFQRFFDGGCKKPKFKSCRDSRQSYTTDGGGIHYENGYLKIPRITPIKVRNKQLLPEGAKICYVTIIHDHEQYKAAINYKLDKEIIEIKPKEENIIGLDYKSNGLYVDSNGYCFNMPRNYRESEEKIAKEQRKLSRKVGSRKGEKPSKNYEKQRKKLNKETKHVANKRKDTLHKESTRLANKYDAICIENLNMKAMANKNFGNGKSTLDNGNGMFTDMLAYKLHERGKQLIVVDKYYPSSQICSHCGHRQKMPLNKRVYDCPVCGNHMDRDHNAAINIRNEGLRILNSQ